MYMYIYIHTERMKVGEIRTSNTDVTNISLYQFFLSTKMRVGGFEPLT